MDAIQLLKADHREVEDLFAKFEAAGGRAKKTKERLVAQIIAALKVHTEIEETIFYPATRGVLPDDEIVLEAYEEHDVAKYVIRELEAIDAGHERYDARVTVLEELIAHHVKEEEKEYFPQARKALGAERIKALGAEMAAAKERLQARTPAMRISMVKEYPVEQPGRDATVSARSETPNAPGRGSSRRTPR